MNISTSITELFSALAGQTCSKAKILLDGAISLGFGKLISTDESGRIRSNFEYELGSYYRNWSIQSSGGRLDPNEVGVDFSELARLAANRLERQVISFVAYDAKLNEIAIEFRNRTHLRFKTNIDVDDEVFHIRTSKFLYVELCPGVGWRSGDSRSPWPQT